jgi:DNA polymerase-3 subunit delta
VPDGERSSGRGEHDALIRELVDGRLGMAGKRMEPGTVSALVERTGTDLRMLSGNLDKLVDFAGGRELITADDVVQVLQRTRQDPLYAFTNAVTDRNLPQALFYMDSLLEGGEINHPLPLLSAVINQVRKLLVIKDFMTKPTGRIWKPSMSYPMFQSRVYPAVQEFDRGLADRIQKWRLAIEDDDAADGPRKKSGRGKGPSSDLLICRQSKSPYPIFKLFLKADRFRIEELIDALQTLEAADRRLKRSGTSGRLALEQVVFRICTPKEN